MTFSLYHILAFILVVWAAALVRMALRGRGR